MKDLEMMRGNGEKVMVADDDLLILDAVKELLMGLGYHVDTAETGESAVALYLARRPDVVILDKNMPGMDGTTTARAILDIDPGAPIILVSGDEDAGMMDAEVPAVRAYLNKPFDVASLAGTLFDVLRS